MSNIHNVEELRAEIQRLKVLSKEQENHLRNDVKQIRENLRPANIASNMFTHVTGVKLDKSDLLKNGLALGVTLFIRRFLMKAESNVEQKVYEFVDKFSDKIKNVVSSYTKKES